MTINVKWSGRRSSGANRQARFSTAHLTAVADAGETAEQVRLHPDIPKINDVDSQNVQRKVSEIEVEQRGASGFYDVRVRYSIPPDGAAHRGKTEDPLDAPVEWQWSIITQEFEVEFDVKGNPLVNSARSPYAPPLTRSVRSSRLDLYRNRATFNTTDSLEYSNAVNLTPFLGAAPGEVMCPEITPTDIYTIDATFVRIAYRFEFRDEATWGHEPFQARVLDKGRRAWGIVAGGTGELAYEVYSRGDQKPVTEDVLLDGRGMLLDTVRYQIGPDDADPFHLDLPPGCVREITQDASGDVIAVWLRWQLYKLRDFNALGIFD